MTFPATATTITLLSFVITWGREGRRRNRGKEKGRREEGGGRREGVSKGESEDNLAGSKKMAGK